jgi:hypothetical protein
MFRDSPEQPVRDFLTALDHPLRDPILVLPAQARQAWLREVIATLGPTTVILYGRPRLSRPHEETLAFWRLRYPETDFYSSGVHGGITLELHADTTMIRPTVREPLPLGG